MSSGVDTSYSASNDKELFELCKEVYKRTGWKYTDHYVVSYALKDGSKHYAEHFEGNKDGDETYESPFYTSDYLLDKLPEVLVTNSDPYEEQWIAGTYGWYDGIGWLDKEVAGTPLKALLKLVIALADAGELS